MATNSGRILKALLLLFLIAEIRGDSKKQIVGVIDVSVKNILADLEQLQTDVNSLTSGTPVSTPEPTATNPITLEPTTPGPTAEPTTPEPTTPEPTTPEPTTPELTTPEPTTPEPSTPEPTTPEPTTPEPTTPEPTTPEPTTPEPTTPEPTTPEPTTPEPTTPEPTTPGQTTEPQIIPRSDVHPVKSSPLQLLRYNLRTLKNILRVEGLCGIPNDQCTTLSNALDTVEKITDEVDAGNIYEGQESEIHGAEDDVSTVVYDEDDEWKAAIDKTVLDSTVGEVSERSSRMASVYVELKNEELGIILGSVFGTIALLLLIAGGAYYYFYRYKPKHSASLTQSHSSSVAEMVDHL